MGLFSSNHHFKSTHWSLIKLKTIYVLFLEIFNEYLITHPWIQLILVGARYPEIKHWRLKLANLCLSWCTITSSSFSAKPASQWYLLIITHVIREMEYIIIAGACGVLCMTDSRVAGYGTE